MTADDAMAAPVGPRAKPHVVVIGAGAAGLLAAASAARHGAEVTVIERNREPGRKLLLSGKGRCNVTYEGDTAALVDGFPGNGRFLFGALSRFGAAQLRAHLSSLGVETKVERGNRVFPVSDDAASVRDALYHDAMAAGCRFRFEQRVTGLQLRPVDIVGDSSGPAVNGVVVTAGGVAETIPADAVIVTTGGASYPGTGSTGDGYALARQAGHLVTPLFPSLVPLETREPWPAQISGLSLRNIRLRAFDAADAELANEFGELLFTHYGVSGPTVLRASRAVSGCLARGGGPARLQIDLKPALDVPVLDDRLRRDFEMFANREFRNSLGRLLPVNLAAQLVVLSGIDPAKRCRDLTRQERAAFGALLKAVPLTVKGTRGFREAIVTAGGVDVREVSPRTMQSTIANGLYFAGEVLDVDGYTGGYNLQAAFATGRLAGESAAQGAGNRE